MGIRIGDRVKLTRNPLDEQLGQYLDTQVNRKVLALRHREGYEDLIKVEGHVDWISVGWFELFDRSKQTFN